MDRFEDFIKKQMTDYSPDGDSWNVPSDDAWNKAMVHFPKKKKRNWLFLPILIGAALLVGGLFYITQDSPSDEQLSTAVVQEKKNIETVATEKITSELTYINEKTETVRTIRATEKMPSPNTNSRVNLEKNKINPNTQPESENQKLGTVSKLVESADNILSKPVRQKSKVVISSHQKAIKSLNVDSSVYASNTSSERKATESNTISSTQLLTEKKKNISSLDLLSPIGLSLAHLSSTSPRSLLEANFDSYVEPSTVSRPFTRQEVGISYAEPLIRLLAVFGYNNPETGDRINLDLKYENVNLHYSIMLFRKWSLSTGIFATQFDMELDVSVREEFDQEAIDEYFSNDSGAPIVQRYSNSPGGSQYNHELLAGAEVVAGDTIHTVGLVNQAGRTFQVPFFLNHHIIKKKVEWIFGLGFGFDFFFPSNYEEDIKFYKDGILVAESLPPFDTDKMYVLNYYYANIGFKYHLNHHWNIGTNLMINTSGIPISNANIGLYYRY